MQNQQPKRWEDRLNTFVRAVASLQEFEQRKELDVLQRAGLVKHFELTFELAWKTLQDNQEAVGLERHPGPRPILQQAVKDGIIADYAIWEKMLKSRNTAAHIYREELAIEVESSIHAGFSQALKALSEKLQKYANA